MDATVKFTDPFWAAAAEQALLALEDAEYVLVPSEFLPLSPRFYPLEFSWGLAGIGRLAWCCSKDDVDRLAPAYHEHAARIDHHCWSNEVFVLGGNFAWRRKADAASREHLKAWFERLERYRAGSPSRHPRTRPFASSSNATSDVPLQSRRVLLVGASGMGNVGDDLLAQVLAEMLTEEGASVFLSGPDIDPLHAATYDAIVVGGGGLIYASRDGSNETQNLANYLKFGPIGAQHGIPTALIGVGDQDHAGMMERDALTYRFTQHCLPMFRAITTRDTESSRLLQRTGGCAVRTGSDPVFATYPRAQRAVKPTAVQPGRIALVGELFAYKCFEQLVGQAQDDFRTLVRDRDFELLVMSNDDVAHCERMRAHLQAAGATAAMVDARDRDLESLIFLFGSYSKVVTTRFHGLILSAMAGVPVAALDIARGKKARLLRDLEARDALIIDGRPEALVALREAIRSSGTCLSEDAVRRCSQDTQPHREALRSLLGRSRLDENAASRAAVVGTSKQKRAPDVIQPLNAEDPGAVNLCWAASSPQTKGFGNLGDSLSAVMVAALSGRPVRHVHFDADRTKLVAVGSIGHAIRSGTAVVWGSGVSIRGGTLAENVRRTKYDVRAVRGPISAQHFRDFGIDVPDVYGDPVWLLPSIINEPVVPRFELGVIPHINDIERPHPDAPAKADSLRYRLDPGEERQIAIINTWHEPTWEGLLAKIRLIRSCKRIASQSFHGVVIAEAYGIPVLNLRAMPGAKNGPIQIDLRKPCTTDPRIWEFFRGGRRDRFHMYSQRRDQRSNWDDIIRAIDSLWSPFEYSAEALAEAFPLPFAYDPLRSVCPNTSHLETLRF